MAKKKIFVAWISLALICLFTNLYAEEFCYADEKFPYVYFGTKTEYELIHITKFQDVPKCVPIKLWLLSRHGTRYPTAKEIQEIKSLTNIRDQIVRNHERDREGSLCYKDLQNLKKWTFNITEDLALELTYQGREELHLHASRMKTQQYPQLFDIPFTSKNFHTTSEKRAIDSAIAFAEGLFSPGAPVEIPPPTENDALLHSYDICPKWQEDKTDPELYKEYNLFRQHKIVTNMLASISLRLGFRNNLTLDVIKIMYDACRYEKAWYIKLKPAFCAVFSHDDLKVMEFLEDIRYYYKYGYGNDLGRKIACPLVKDLIQRFGDVVKKGDESNEPPVTLYFSHSATLLTMISALGIKKDNNPLTHDSFESMLKREWRTSFMSPFSGNLEAVLYRCEPDNDTKIMFRLNEDIVPYPGCHVGLCSWKYIEDKFSSLTDPATCNLDFCNSTSLAFTLSANNYFSYFSLIIIYSIVNRFLVLK